MILIFEHFSMYIFDGNIQYTIIPMKRLLSFMKKRFLDVRYELRFLARNILDNDI